MVNLDHLVKVVSAVFLHCKFSVFAIELIIFMREIYETMQISCFFFFLLHFFFFVFFFFRVTPMVYGGSQARGQIGAVAAGLCHSHSNTGSKLCL